MIFYFSGTGNSRWAAEKIAAKLGDTLVDMAADKMPGHSFVSGQVVGVVFPVYAWGPPKIVLSFIEKMQINSYQKNYVFCVITCGDSVGDAMRATATALSKKGLTTDAAFSVTMPNNYILLGDVDSKAKEAKKLAAAKETLQQINA